MNPLDNILHFPTAKVRREIEINKEKQRDNKHYHNYRCAMTVQAQGKDAHFMQCTHISDQPLYVSYKVPLENPDGDFYDNPKEPA